MSTLNENVRLDIRNSNIKIIASKGYRYIEWLPIHEEPKLRSFKEVIGRMSVMNALINISFGAPTDYIKEWIREEGLTSSLSKWEKEILTKDQEELSEFEINSLRWYLEGLWALMWVTQMANELDETQWIPNSMASMLPNLEEGDDNSILNNLTEMRSEIEIYTMMDYYYRLHWYCVDERIKDQQATINEGIIYERRRALEWLLDIESDWDNIEMGT
ncbi:MAG: DUF4272 domain-containing protein [Myroides sp.]|jgi:hypothetical protein|nr:DUF4272 domain-containing protein [Myroides sp.]